MLNKYIGILAQRLEAGNTVALYCYGIFASHILCTLEKLSGKLPAVVIDNDERKRGRADFGVPVMPFEEARERYSGLQYFICSDDFKYTIIGDMLEKGVSPEEIINYIPVEKDLTCLPIRNRLLIDLYPKSAQVHGIQSCCEASFENSLQAAQSSIQVPAEDEKYDGLENILSAELSRYDRGEVDICKSCALRQEQYIVRKGYKKRYKQIAFYQQSCADCLAHCVYCCAGASDKNLRASAEFQTDSLEYYAAFVDKLLSLGWIDDDFTCAVDMSERDSDKKIGFVVNSLQKANLTPMLYKVGSCLLTYSKNLEDLLRQGSVYIIWSLDAGSRETYRKIKQIDAFNQVVENVKRYIQADAFHGRFIVAKYLIVKGVNDREEEFDAYLLLVTELGLKYVSISFNFFIEADEFDLEFIRRCYSKIVACGLQLTNKNNSEAVTKALAMLSMRRQSL
ncbi:MAG: hypothetical protein K2O18_10965 [Oscillospiraceae bacterium]|nr:hypothetical protein [Oscillospiraceae bacterium]